MIVTCNQCGFSGPIDRVRLHSCQIQEQGGRCEDYPACGHTDGDGCQTLPEHTSEYWMRPENAIHLGCDHEAGFCDAYMDDYDEEEEDES